MGKRVEGMEKSVVCLVLCVSLSGGMEAAVAAAERSCGSIGGLYALGMLNKPVPDGVLANKNVDGLALRFPWDALEPREGDFNWQAIDDAIGAARSQGKRVSLSVEAGVHTPAWVYAAGAAPFHLVWDQGWGPALCTLQQLPIPWDSVFISKWRTLIAELGRRYDSNPLVTHVKMTGLNSYSQETNLPHSRDKTISGGSKNCTSGDETSEWQKAGYTRARVEEAWVQIGDAFARAFPNKKMAIMLGPAAFPPLDGAGKPIRSRDGDYQLGLDLIAEGRRRYGTQFVVQNNGLSAFWDWERVSELSGTSCTGYQMLWAATNDSKCRMNRGSTPCDPKPTLEAALMRGIDKGASFLEVYPADILNPALQEALARARSRLSHTSDTGLLGRP
jgi:hypothetical protein